MFQQKTHFSLFFTIPQAIQLCDKGGPLLIEALNLLDDTFGIARIFSGKLSESTTPFFVNNQKKEGVWKLFICQRWNPLPLSNVFAGQIFLFDCQFVKSGLFIFIYFYYCLKITIYFTGTISINPSISLPIKTDKNLPHLFGKWVEPSHPIELSLFIKLVRKLTQSSPMVSWMPNYLGRSSSSIWGTSEAVVLRWIEIFQKIATIPIQVSSLTLIRNYETIDGYSFPCYGKSPNKHNKLEMEASPLPERAILMLENEEEKEKEMGERKQELDEWKNKLEVLGVMINSDRNAVWKHRNGNLLICEVEQKKGEIQEVRNSIIGGFVNACDYGPLTNEPLRGLCFRVTDLALHSDAIHRGPGQFVSLSQRVMHGCLLRADPDLIEPVLEIEIGCFSIAVDLVVRVFEKRKGRMIKKREQRGDDEPSRRRVGQFLVSGWVRAIHLIGIGPELDAIDGVIHSEFTDFHWESVKKRERGLIEFKEMIQAIRVEKGLRPELPNPDHFAIESEQKNIVNLKPAKSK